MKRITIFLLLTVFAQISILGGMYVSASMPLWTGTEIRLITVPRDPRSLFRGNYARLNYDISSIPSSHFEKLENLRHGEIVYVSLVVKKGIAQLPKVSKVSLTKPKAGLFIKGRLHRPNIAGQMQQVTYGLEAFFAPKEKALSLERTLGAGAVAVVMLSSSGKAALQSIERKDK